jgi:hypothetical protein
MTYLQEYDLDIRSSKIVRGQGLCKLAAKWTKEKGDQDELYEDQILLEKEVFYIHVNNNTWYYEMKCNFTHGSTPHHMEPKKTRDIRLK